MRVPRLIYAFRKLNYLCVEFKFLLFSSIHKYIFDGRIATAAAVELSV